MSVKPILFNADMVRAILDNRKTVMRRVVKLQPEGAHSILDCDEEKRTFDLLCGNGGVGGVFADWAETIKAPFWPGDILYVRETWQKNPYGIGWPYFYKASPEAFDHAPDKWHPSIHMPFKAARIFLQVTDVWVERLQDITEEQARKEGAEGWLVASTRDWDKNPDYILSFRHIWNQTVKKKYLSLYGWDANPWVWVIKFERIEKPESEEKNYVGLDQR